MSEKNYERVNWQARKTPISAANLNRMDEGIADNRQAIQELQSAISGVFPCGEGAGYAGGITSAAMDGLRIAEALRKIYRPISQTD